MHLQLQPDKPPPLATNPNADQSVTMFALADLKNYLYNMTMPRFCTFQLNSAISFFQNASLHYILMVKCRTVVLSDIWKSYV